MPWAVAAAVVVGAGISAYGQYKSAEEAAAAQEEAALAGMSAEERAQERMRKTLQPYVESGEDAMKAQRALLGLEGEQAQQDAVNQVQQNPNFMALVQQGEGALLQNAAATGGLRGGNTQAALAQFRPQMLNQALQQQYQNLGGLTQIGQASAAQQAAGQMQFGRDIAGLYGNIGQAQAGAALGKGEAIQTIGSGISSLGGLYAGGGF